MSNRIPGLDLLRSMAIGLVMVQHQALFFIVTQQTWIPRWLTTGPFGVDLFFVLSGFLIGGILLDIGDRLQGPRVVSGFWFSRWLRTLPNYYLFLGVNIAIWFGLGIPPTPWRTILWYPFFFQNIVHHIDRFYVESWSLCVEEWFYLFFPLMLCVGMNLGVRFNRVYMAAVAVLIFVPIILRTTMPAPHDWGLDVNMVVFHKFDALGLGVATVYAVRAWPSLWRRLATPAAAGGLALVAECYVYSCRSNLTASFFARSLYPTIESFGWALLLPWAAQCGTLGGGWFERSTAAVARWSYSLYLTNFVISVLLTDFLQPRIQGIAAGVIVCEVLFLSISLSMSAALYRWVELPFLRMRLRIPICVEARPARARQLA